MVWGVHVVVGMSMNGRLGIPGRWLPSKSLSNKLGAHDFVHRYSSIDRAYGKIWAELTLLLWRARNLYTAVLVRTLRNINRCGSCTQRSWHLPQATTELGTDAFGHVGSGEFEGKRQEVLLVQTSGRQTEK